MLELQNIDIFFSGGKLKAQINLSDPETQVGQAVVTDFEELLLKQAIGVASYNMISSPKPADADKAEAKEGK